jgi:hypothetical protein
MKAYAAGVLLAILGFFAWMYLWLDAPKLETYPAAPVSVTPHVYQGERSISSLDLLVVYFVPSDREAVEDEIWKTSVADAVRKLKEFHDVQLQHRSTLNVVIRDALVTGEKTGKEYDTDDTNEGNPAGLRAISEELELRLSPGGDLHSELANFNGRRPIVYIVYEGVGSSGSPDGSALINRRFLTDTMSIAYGTSHFVHEFYHTIGVPDAYDSEDISFESDIMGLGRRRPLEVNYLSAATLKSLGF